MIDETTHTMGAGPSGVLRPIHDLKPSRLPGGRGISHAEFITLCVTRPAPIRATSPELEEPGTGMTPRMVGRMLTIEGTVQHRRTGGRACRC